MRKEKIGKRGSWSGRGVAGDMGSAFSSSFLICEEKVQVGIINDTENGAGRHFANLLCGQIDWFRGQLQLGLSRQPENPLESQGLSAREVVLAILQPDRQIALTDCRGHAGTRHGIIHFFQLDDIVTGLRAVPVTGGEMTLDTTLLVDTDGIQSF